MLQSFGFQEELSTFASIVLTQRGAYYRLIPTALCCNDACFITLHIYNYGPWLKNNAKLS